MEAPLRHLADTKDIFCCDTRYRSLVLNATYSYVHPHEITVGKTVGIPHETRGSSPLWATAYWWLARRLSVGLWFLSACRRADKYYDNEISLSRH
jgi:hypothetical protein